MNETLRELTALLAGLGRRAPRPRYGQVRLVVPQDEPYSLGLIPLSFEQDALTYLMTETKARQLLELAGVPLFRYLSVLLKEGLFGASPGHGLVMARQLTMLVSDVFTHEIGTPPRRIVGEMDLAGLCLVFSINDGLIAPRLAMDYFTYAWEVAVSDGARRTANRRFLQARNFFKGRHQCRQHKYAEKHLPLPRNIRNFCLARLISVRSASVRRISLEDLRTFLAALGTLAHTDSLGLALVLGAALGGLRPKEARQRVRVWLSDFFTQYHLQVTSRAGKMGRGRRVTLPPGGENLLLLLDSADAVMESHDPRENDKVYARMLVWLRDHGIHETCPLEFLRHIVLTVMAIRFEMEGARQMGGHSTEDTAYINYLLHDFTDEMADLFLAQMDRLKTILSHERLFAGALIENAS